MSRGRIRALLGALPSYVRIGWWGLAAPRLTEREPLVVHQAVVLGDAGVLLAERSELRGFELPGGEAQPGETGEAAVAREVREETGVEVSVEGCVAEYERTGFRPHRARIYRCRAIGGALRPSAETTRVAWFDPRVLPDSLFPWCRGPLADAVAPAKPGAPPVRREHQGLASVLAAIAIDLRSRLRG
ncbi:MAG TPA: NUDIX domain-containing protein [Myxococcota bacterium]|nr:NUDIX domain-containing protein [Myxococcota bacterium]